MYSNDDIGSRLQHYTTKGILAVPTLPSLYLFIYFILLFIITVLIQEDRDYRLRKIFPFYIT